MRHKSSLPLAGRLLLLAFLSVFFFLSGCGKSVFEDIPENFEKPDESSLYFESKESGPWNEDHLSERSGEDPPSDLPQLIEYFPDEESENAEAIKEAGEGGETNHNGGSERTEESDESVETGKSEDTEETSDTDVPGDTGETAGTAVSGGTEKTAFIREDGSYSSRDDVALYIHLYGKLPGNFITKSEARALGWEGGDLSPFAKGKCIGGDRFGNYEGLLPEKEGRIYRECDIDTLGQKKRGAKRIIYSNDGLIYYTEDHYESFSILYALSEDAGNE